MEETLLLMDANREGVRLAVMGGADDATTECGQSERSALEGPPWELAIAVGNARWL
jgi:hypothetical protein